MILENPGRIKVVYIAGWGRSGSTILGSILGQASGFHFFGEIQYLWQRGIIENQQCGCGANFKSCTVWSKIIKRVFESHDVDPQVLARLAYQQTRTRNMGNIVLGAHLGRKPKILQDYLEKLDILYGAIQRVTGSKVIVDSSKSPIYAAVLGLVPNLDVYFIHLVRDSRAVAYSYATQKIIKDRSKPVRLAVKTPIFTAFMWMSWNLIAEVTGALRIVKYYKLKYEDFATQSQKYTDEILSFIGEPQGSILFAPENMVFLEPKHSVSGNPSRFHVGNIKIAIDNRWSKSLSIESRILVDLITWPLLLRYRYLF